MGPKVRRQVALGRRGIINIVMPTWSSSVVCTWDDEQIAEERLFYDHVGLTKQLGLM